MIVHFSKEEHAVHEDDRKIRLFYVDYRQFRKSNAYDIDDVLRNDALKLVSSGKSSLVLCNDDAVTPRDVYQLVQLCSAFGYVDDDCEHMVFVASSNSLDSYDAALRFADAAGKSFILVADAHEEGELPKSFYDDVDCIYDDNKKLNSQWRFRRYPRGSRHADRVRGVIWGSCISTLVWCVSKFDDQDTGSSSGKYDRYNDMVSEYGNITVEALLGQWELEWTENAELSLSSIDHSTIRGHAYALEDDERRLLYKLDGISDIIDSACASRMPFGVPEYIGLDEYNEKLMAVREFMSETCINEQIELLLNGVPLEDIMA